MDQTRNEETHSFETSSSRHSTDICTKDADVYGTPCVFSGPPRRPQGGSVQGPQLFTVRIQRAREQPNNFIHEPVKLIRGASLGSEEAIGSGPLPAVARTSKSQQHKRNRFALTKHCWIDNTTGTGTLGVHYCS